MSDINKIELNNIGRDIISPDFDLTILKEKLARIPAKPGIYIHKNKFDKIIYIGKAKNLRNRIRSYFQDGRPADAKTKALIRNIADFDFIVTDTEAEALLLEDTLIKKHKPKYNILLKDDKSFPYVRVTNEPYPRIFSTRNIVKDGSKYFGPFTEVGHMKRVMELLRTLFYIRSCRFDLNDITVANKKYKICLDYHINKCLAPCQDLISKENYNYNINLAIEVLKGKTKIVEKQLEDKMLTLSNDLKFEEAAIVKNQYVSLREYISKQKIISNDSTDRDIFALVRNDDYACSMIFKIRDGKLIGKRHYIITNSSDTPDSIIIEKSIEKWYLESDMVPKEIFLPIEPDNIDFLRNWLIDLKESSVDIIVPKIGEKRKFMNLVSANAELMLTEYIIANNKRDYVIPHSVIALQRDLRMKIAPRRIECFDNSHFQGSELVSSCVVFVDGKPKKSDYRKFKNETVGKNDDFAAMQEVIKRRYERVLIENEILPDLIIIDGGKGQLSHAVEILKELGIYGKTTIIGLAKRIEEVFFPGERDSLILPKTSSGLKLLQQARDEAHRFAITFHRSLRDKRTLNTELTNINGLGDKTAEKLLIEFGSVKNIKESDFNALSAVVGSKLANNIIDYFSNNHEDNEIIIDY